MMEVILGAIIGKLSLIKRGDILSIPGAFLLGIELTIPLTREYRGKRELVCDSIIFLECITEFSRKKLGLCHRRSPNRAQKPVNSFATVWSSFVKLLTFAGFFGMHDLIAFQIFPTSLGFRFICSSKNSLCASRISRMSSRLKFR